MSILVTGGSGYIGTHTLVELLNEGYETIVVDNFSNSKPEAIKRVSEITEKDFNVYNLDLLDKSALETVFKENNIQAVIHFAGLKAVGESVKEPLLYYKNNIEGTINLCEVMNKYNVKNILFSSSATVYGSPNIVPISENFPRSSTNPYGRTKLMIEDILNDLYRSDNEWSITILRYFNPIRAHESGKIGEDPTGIPNNLVPYITKVAVGELERVNVFGNDYPTKDGTGVRDYIHVIDLAIGHVKALSNNMTQKGVKTYNLGNGIGYSVLEVIEAFEKTCGKKIPYSFTERRPGDIGVSYADPSKASQELNWVATRGIKEMCEDSWRWQINNPNGYGVENKIFNGKEDPCLKNGDFLIGKSF